MDVLWWKSEQETSYKTPTVNIKAEGRALSTWLTDLTLHLEQAPNGRGGDGRAAWAYWSGAMLH